MGLADVLIMDAVVTLVALAMVLNICLIRERIVEVRGNEHF